MRSSTSSSPFSYLHLIFCLAFPIAMSVSVLLWARLNSCPRHSKILLEYYVDNRHEFFDVCMYGSAIVHNIPNFLGMHTLHIGVPLKREVLLLNILCQFPCGVSYGNVICRCRSPKHDSRLPGSCEFP